MKSDNKKLTKSLVYFIYIIIINVSNNYQYKNYFILIILLFINLPFQKYIQSLRLIFTFKTRFKFI
jgi:hypothetical protein